MHLLVLRQRKRFLECPATFIAHIFAFLPVRTQVGFQRRRKFEALRTELAHEVFAFGVSECVCFQAFFCEEVFSANVAKLIGDVQVFRINVTPDFLSYFCSVRTQFAAEIAVTGLIEVFGVVQLEVRSEGDCVGEFLAAALAWVPDFLPVGLYVCDQTDLFGKFFVADGTFGSDPARVR